MAASINSSFVQNLPRNRFRKWRENSSSVETNRSVCKRVSLGIKAQDKSRDIGKTVSRKGWFYDTFVDGQTFSDKIAKMTKDSKENKSVTTLFDNSFQYTSWIEVHRALTERKLPSVEAKTALSMVKSPFQKAILLDVREEQDFNYSHPAGAISVPLFQLIQGNDLKANLRRLGYALMTEFSGSERNPSFVTDAEKAVFGNKKRNVIVVCSRGGSLDTVVVRTGPKAKVYKDPWRVFGISSRSLKACYELQEAGFSNVYHLKGGFSQWRFDGLPVENNR